MTQEVLQGEDISHAEAVGQILTRCGIQTVSATLNQTKPPFVMSVEEFTKEIENSYYNAQMSLHGNARREIAFRGLSENGEFKIQPAVKTVDGNLYMLNTVIVSANDVMLNTVVYSKKINGTNNLIQPCKLLFLMNE